MKEHRENTTGTTKFIMVQGTMSSAGKSLVVAGLCRVFKQDGYRVAPFKSQNMALNSFVTEDGLEMGRAQVMQAEAAGVKPSVYMNPILLKPTDDVGSQVIVNGKVIGNMKARDYFEYKTKLVPDILAAVDELKKTADIIVIEGAGSPAEINLKSNDIVNMGMAKLVDAPVLLVGDIDRGGVFAQLLGTIELLEEDERARVKGLVINKFRGDKTILDPGIEMLEERANIPVCGVIPYVDINLEDEDSLTDRFDSIVKGVIDIAVIKLPHISNFTDFNVFDQIPEVKIRYVRNARDLGNPDMIILPGSKSTIADGRWLIETGMDIVIRKYSKAGGVLFGICGGYQLLGVEISDPLGVENGGSIRGLGMLPVVTKLTSEKTRSQTQGRIVMSTGILSDLSGKSYIGYEIHMGETVPVSEYEVGDITTFSEDINISEFTDKGTGYCNGDIYGTYIHGFFDDEDIVKSITEALAKRKGLEVNLDSVTDYADFKEKEYDRLADTMREFMDMNKIYKLMEL